MLASGTITTSQSSLERNMQTWQLQDAKSKFSQLVDLAMKGDTQVVTKRGVEAVAIISVDALNKLKRNKNSQSLVSTLMNGPKYELNLTRSDEPTRDINF